MPASSLMPMPKQAFFATVNGVHGPIVGGYVYFYESGTVTPKNAYTTAAGTVPAANPIRLNARGEPATGVFLGTGVYSIKLCDANNAEIWTVDDIEASITTANLYSLLDNSRVVDSIADLKALDKTKYTRAFVTGYTAAGDGGGGHYRYDSADTTSADNGGTIIVATDGARWKLLFDNFVTVEQFGAKGDGVTDDTAKINAARTAAKAAGVEVWFAAKTYKTSAVVNIAGAVLRGQAGGYRNANGTIIQGSGGHNIFEQVTANTDDTHIGLHNFRLKGGTIGAKVRYMLHSHWSNVHVTDCTDGVQFGNSSDAGGLFCTFDNIETDVTGTGLDVNGKDFVNANSFNQCFFKGGNYGGRVRCSGGIGAVNNVFNCTEFLGDRYGIELDNTSNTVFNQPYFESIGPSLLLSGTRNIGWSINEAVFAKLENTNPTGRNSFIYHAGTGTGRGTVNGGWVYIPAAAKYNNLTLVASDTPENFYLTMLDQPEYDVAATGFSVLSASLVSANLNINENKSYTPAWTASGSNPSLGNGTLSGRVVRSGGQVTVTIALTIGSTTTFGSGDWLFSIPYPAALASAGVARVVDSGTGYNMGAAGIETGSSQLAIYRPGTAELYDSNSPQVWAANDSLIITITYPG